MLSAFFSGKHGFHVSPAIAARKYIKLVKTRLAPPRIVDKKKHEGTEALKQKQYNVNLLFLVHGITKIQTKKLSIASSEFLLSCDIRAP